LALRRGSLRGRPSSRRAKAWAIGPGASTSTSFTSTTAAILGSGAVLATESKVTILRVRGMITVRLITATSIGDGFHFAIGLGIVSSDAFGVGVTAVPNPIADAQWDGWMWHQFGDVHQITGAEADGSNAVSNIMRIPVDTKAMRKFGDNETLMFNMEVVEVGTSNITVFADSRQLLLV